MRSVFLFCTLFFLPCLPSVADDTRQTVDLVSVVDGDTIRVSDGGERKLVRLIGIDSPEQQPNRRATMQAERSHTTVDAILDLGMRSARFARSLYQNSRTVELEYDVERKDRYGRLLAYVYLPGGTFINKEMLRLGYAHLLTVPPNVTRREELAAAYREGRTAKRGLWGFEGFE